MHDELVKESRIDMPNLARVSLRAKFVVFILTLIPDVVVRELVHEGAIVDDALVRVLFTTFWLYVI